MTYPALFVKRLDHVLTLDSFLANDNETDCRYPLRPSRLRITDNPNTPLKLFRLRQISQ